MSWHPWKTDDFRTKASGKQPEIREVYERGLTVAAVARWFGMSRETATKAIVDAGGAIRPKGTRGVPS